MYYSNVHNYNGPLLGPADIVTYGEFVSTCLFLWLWHPVYICKSYTMVLYLMYTCHYIHPYNVCTLPHDHITQCKINTITCKAPGTQDDLTWYTCTMHISSNVNYNCWILRPSSSILWMHLSKQSWKKMYLLNSLKVFFEENVVLHLHKNLYGLQQAQLGLNNWGMCWLLVDFIKGQWNDACSFTRMSFVLWMRKTACSFWGE